MRHTHRLTRLPLITALALVGCGKAAEAPRGISVSIDAQFRSIDAAAIEATVNGRRVSFAPDSNPRPRVVAIPAAPATPTLALRFVAYGADGARLADVATTRAMRPGVNAAASVFVAPQRPLPGLCSTIVAAAPLRNGRGETLFVSFGGAPPGATC
jgi:hypothetical protein